MSEETKVILIKRLKSFGWRLGCYAAVALLALVADNLSLFNLPPLVVTIIALAVGEATKWINSNTALMGGKGK